MKKERAKLVEKGILLAWSSLESHLIWTYYHSSEGEKFHKDAVKSYADIIKILSELY